MDFFKEIIELSINVTGWTNPNCTLVRLCHEKGIWIHRASEERELLE